MVFATVDKAVKQERRGHVKANLNSTESWAANKRRWGMSRRHVEDVTVVLISMPVLFVACNSISACICVRKGTK